MRFTSVAFSTLLCTVSISFAVPVPILDQIGNFIEDLVPGDATFEGVAGAVQDAIENPALTIARVQVVKGLDESRTALNDIIAQGPATGNDELAAAAEEALAGIDTAGAAVDLIGQAINAGVTPDPNDQATVAEGTFTAQIAIGEFAALLVAPDAALESSIADASSGVALLRKGVDGVLAASGISFEDLGVVPPELGGGEIVDEATEALDGEEVIETVVEDVVEATEVLDGEEVIESAVEDGTEIVTDIATDVVEATETLDEVAVTETAVDDIAQPTETVVEEVAQPTETAPALPEATEEAAVIDEPVADNSQAIFDEIERLINELKAAQGIAKRRA